MVLGSNQPLKEISNSFTVPMKLSSMTLYKALTENDMKVK